MDSEQKTEVMAAIKKQTMVGADTTGVQPFISGKLFDVMVYKGNITQLSVDAIVNAANGRLAHGVGVARAIADAAGDDLLKEGNQYIREHGVISVTGVAVTTAGRLPCKKVIHAVGPAMYDYKDKTECLEDLCKTILRCLCEARNLNMSSVAIPSISSGKYIIFVKWELDIAMWL
ncbi:protein mono-ADP-ribosyltransferase PARP9-like [Gigantopelta aegis]|uniref:protein mono-ADP-ribosyltransferase PARP9-like n=1 Tax=Gigantopelta aegis TaxID=1735272 RepID=UPI001B887DD5|nr:protein mono-ADP-ribosyltransferase PARP9-like [Gigantopelta aegis]